MTHHLLAASCFVVHDLILGHVSEHVQCLQLARLVVMSEASLLAVSRDGLGDCGREGVQDHLVALDVGVQEHLLDLPSEPVDDDSDVVEINPDVLEEWLPDLLVLSDGLLDLLDSHVLHLSVLTLEPDLLLEDLLEVTG